MKEELADAVAALSQIEELLPRLRPLRQAFERINALHEENKRLCQKVEERK